MTTTTDRSLEASPQMRARIAGVFYLVTFVGGGLALRGRSLGPYFYVANLIATAAYVGVTLLFYGLFKPVNRGLSLSRRSSASPDSLWGRSASCGSPPSPSTTWSFSVSIAC